MTKTAISVQGLGKQYRIGARQESYQTLRDSLSRAFTSPFRGAKRLLLPRQTNDHESTVWALKDVSFEVQQGEVVGIIGRNGAGKSTLLKILSRISDPTEGRAVIRGRVGTLLEVGTGFHPELTGRENIYLNGAILGMKRREIERKFDEIVAFSEIEQFIDTPVKHYSSGMYVRLAFAVAAHLEPDILFVDEVLAVGDVAFQKKCFEKMNSIATLGSTILVVSHNLNSINRLCERALLLNNGQLQCDGPVTDVIAAYMKTTMEIGNQREWNDQATAPGNDTVRLKSIKAFSESGETNGVFDIRHPIAIEFEYWVCKDEAKLNPAFFLLNEMENIVLISGGMHDLDWVDRPRSPGLYKSRCWIPGNLLAEGTYTIRAIIHTLNHEVPRPVIHANESNVITFQVYDPLEGGSARGYHRGAYYGVVRPILDWETQLPND